MRPVAALEHGPITQSSGSQSVSAAAESAWRSSRFREALGEQADEMLAGAIECRTAAGAELRLIDKASGRSLVFIVAGLLRVYTISAQGRQVTIRYAHQGDVVGLATLVAPAYVGDGNLLAVQAMSPCHVVRMCAHRSRRIAALHPGVMWGLFSELARALISSQHMLAENLFRPVRSRVARHLLDMARSEDGRLVVHASPQDIADAIGSVREVVSRAAVRLRDEGVIEREGSTHVIADPRTLLRISEEG